MGQIVKNSPSVSVANVIQTIEDLAFNAGVDSRDILAEMIRRQVISKTALGKLLRYVIDVASDEFLSEEFYHSHPDVLVFLARAGSGVEELLYRAYCATHPDIFICKKCKSPLIGGCPIMTCSNPDCNKSFIIQIDGITDVMCKNCVANMLGECTEHRREYLYKIFALYGEDHGI